MSAGSGSYHEPIDLLSEDTKNMHRALVSLQEELEAVDWYQQRADACSDPELSAILVHNMNEEIEHAMMTLEWIRRRHGRFDQEVGTYLKTTGPITELEEAAMDGEGSGEVSGEVSRSGDDGSLGIGSLKSNEGEA